jgi:hypothetical protein
MNTKINLITQSSRNKYNLGLIKKTKLEIKDYKIPLRTSILAFLTISCKKHFKNTVRCQSSKIIIRSKSNLLEGETRTIQNNDNRLKSTFLQKLKLGDKSNQNSYQIKSNENVNTFKSTQKNQIIRNKACLDKKLESFSTDKLNSRGKKSENASNSMHNKLNYQKKKSSSIKDKNRSFSMNNNFGAKKESKKSLLSYDNLNSLESSKDIISKSQSSSIIEYQLKKIYKVNSFSSKRSITKITNNFTKNDDTKSFGDSDKFIFINHLQIDHDSLRENGGAFLESNDSSDDLNHSIGTEITFA